MTTLDHFDPTFTADPYTTWAAMRAEDPVWYWADLDSYMVVDHRIAREVLRDGDAFTLNRYAWEHFDPEADEVERPLLGVTSEDGIFQAAPDDHARLRKPVVPTFSPAAAERHRHRSLQTGNVGRGRNHSLQRQRRLLARRAGVGRHRDARHCR